MSSINLDLVPKILCLCVHDSVGGCDGWLFGVGQSNNNGLEGLIEFLEPIVQQYNSQRGTGQDIWACAALMVAEISQPMDRSQIDVFLRHYGRVLVSKDVP
jgi:hypothetical protein